MKLETLDLFDSTCLKNSEYYDKDHRRDVMADIERVKTLYNGNLYISLHFDVG